MDKDEAILADQQRETALRRLEAQASREDQRRAYLGWLRATSAPLETFAPRQEKEEKP
jgi:hypothetical protein